MTSFDLLTDVLFCCNKQDGKGGALLMIPTPIPEKRRPYQQTHLRLAALTNDRLGPGTLTGKTFVNHLKPENP